MLRADNSLAATIQVSPPFILEMPRKWPTHYETVVNCNINYILENIPLLFEIRLI